MAESVKIKSAPEGRKFSRFMRNPKVNLGFIVVGGACMVSILGVAMHSGKMLRRNPEYIRLQAEDQKIADRQNSIAVQISELQSNSDAMWVQRDEIESKSAGLDSSGSALTLPLAFGGTALMMIGIKNIFGRNSCRRPKFTKPD